MAFALRTSGSSPSPTTQLVKALINFGQDDPQPSSAPSAKPPGGAPGEEDEHDPDLDAEEEDVVAGGNKAKSTTNRPKPSLQKTADLAGLSLSEAEPKAGPSAPAPPTKVPRSLKSLLRSSDHSITIETDAGPVERTLTSWKMADYAYKRDPCPFPTRARGLFTDKVEGDKGQEEYRIVARGYDKFFNVGEVSWTQVSGSWAVLGRAAESRDR